MKSYDKSMIMSLSNEMRKCPNKKTGQKGSKKYLSYITIE